MSNVARVQQIRDIRFINTSVADFLLLISLASNGEVMSH
jgi:hypothetical protein